MRLSRGITGWAFLVEVDGVRHAGLAVGLADISPFTTGGGEGGSLFARAYALGLPALLSLDALPFDRPVDLRWCVTQDEVGALCVLSPDGAQFAYDLELKEPPNWRETAVASGSVVLVVSHVFPVTDDPLGALAFETRQGMVCAGPVRFGEPAYEADDEPKITFLLDPVGVLLELAHHVFDRILSLDAAKRRARELEEMRQTLAQHRGPSAETMVELLMRDQLLDHRGLVELMFSYWRLVAEVADVCEAEAAWRVAALRTVELAAPLLADRCDRKVFEEAAGLAARLIERLSDSADLEAALMAAARLRMASRGPQDAAADAYARGVLTTWSARLESDLYRTWFTDEEPFQAESHRLLMEAADLVLRALDLDGGTRRARLLASLAQILANEEGVHRDAASAALTILLDLPGIEEPDLALFLLRVVEGLSPDTLSGVLAEVFGTPLPEFVAAHGRTVTAKVISQGVNLALERADRTLLQTVLDWEGQLDIRWDTAHRRQMIEAQLHVLAEDPTDCTGHFHAASVAQMESWTPTQRSAALIHAAAHARDHQQPALGLALLRQASDGMSEHVRLLTADLYYLSAKVGEPASSPVPFPWGYYTYAALAYGSLRFEELARASLVPFVQSLGDLRGEELRGALYAIIVDVPNFDTSGAPELGELLRDLVHSSVWQLAAEIETLPMGLMLGLHQAGKGPALGAWSRINGPLTMPGHIQHFIGKLRDLEKPAASSGTLPNLLNVLDADQRPSGHDNTEIVRNLRWRISSFIDDELRICSTPLIDDQHLWAKAHELLDDRTVLLTWFLPAAVSGGAVLLAVTSRGRELVVHLGDEADANSDRHPVADQVDAIRTEVERDPLFGDVTPEGNRLLGLGDLPLGGSDRWAQWRAQGKDRILAWPHGALHYLPIPLCRAGDRMIADDWTVITIAGLEALTPVESPLRPCRTAVLASADGGVPHGLHAEPMLEEHAQKVAEAVGAQAITGSAATRDRLLAELSTADVLHIAVHGTLDQDAPWMHCLYLTADHDDDGRAFAYDLLEVDLRGVRLVTLAACESALGRFDRADNVRGIPSALIAAGVQAVVGCLWPVRPEPATYFYQHMHHRIAHGADPERAFRDAQLATRAQHPHYRDWGAFTYLRGWSEGALA